MSNTTPGFDSSKPQENPEQDDDAEPLFPNATAVESDDDNDVPHDNVFSPIPYSEVQEVLDSLCESIRRNDSSETNREGDDEWL